VRRQKAPFVPELDGDCDIKYFDKYEEIDPWVDIECRDEQLVSRS